MCERRAISSRRRALAKGVADGPESGSGGPFRSNPSAGSPVRHPAGAAGNLLLLFERHEPGRIGFETRERFAERLFESAADGHDFAHGFHLRGEDRLGGAEFLEIKARDLGHDVIDRRLERAGRGAGDVVGELVERVADGKLGRHARDREARGLGGQRARSAKRADSSR